MGGVAILGAGGFVGTRLLEMAVLGGRTDIVPVVRSFRSVARNARLGVPHRLGDASRPDSLGRALDGCDTVVNLTAGDSADILRTTESIYAAALAARARVLIHMSTAAVYGRVDQPDLPDDAPPRLDHWMLYARQKGLAENFLRERMADRRIAIVVLRPSLIWGPGSHWVMRPATELLDGNAYLIGGGDGICDLVYVDNLVRSIDAVARHPAPPSGFYHVADNERTTWRDYYAALADGLGVDMKTVHIVGDRYRVGLRDRVEELKELPAYAWLKGRLSLEARTAIKLRLARARARDRAAGPAANGNPVVTREMWGLQTTRSALPTGKFLATYGDQNRTSFASGIAASLAWLRFIGLGADDLPGRARPNADRAAAVTGIPS
jgi:nucleoside-diphosphate-sugar epimerase